LREQPTALKTLLAERGIRASWLAAQLGMSQWMFHHIEARRKNVPPGHYERIAEILDVPVARIAPDHSVDQVAV
jgi:DNA-binding Xre family transcriptional regulator